MGKRYGIALLGFKVGVTEVEQGVGVQQYLAMWVAGATTKNGTWFCRN